MNEGIEKTNTSLFKYSDPLRLLVTIMASIFIVELGIMTALQYFYKSSGPLATLIDAAALVVVTFPVLYYFVLKPLSSQEALFSTLAQKSPDCIKLLDREGNILFINDGGLKEHNYASVEEAKKHGVLGTLVPESRKVFEDALVAATRGETVSIEIQHTPEGSNREFCAELITPIRNTRGEIAGVMGISRDISRRKKMAEELQEKVGDLERMNKLMIGRELKMAELKKEVEALKRGPPAS